MHRYEDMMRSYADRIVDDSIAPLRWQRRARRPLVYGATTAVLIGARMARELVRQ